MGHDGVRDWVLADTAVGSLKLYETAAGLMFTADAAMAEPWAAEAMGWLKYRGHLATPVGFVATEFSWLRPAVGLPTQIVRRASLAHIALITASTGGAFPGAGCWLA